MFGSSRRPPHWWLRALMSFLFFVGGGLFVVWAQGFRFDFQHHHLFPTGVLSVSSAPEGLPVTINGKYLGETPGVFLGQRLGNHDVCLFPTTASPLCFSVAVQGERVTNVSHILFPPEELLARHVGAQQDILIDPQERGYITLFPQFSEARIQEGSRDQIITLPALSDNLPALSREGILYFGNGSSQTAFFSSPFSFSSLRFFPDDEHNSFLYTENDRLFFRNASEKQSQLLGTFSEPIESAWFFPHSESILVFLPSSIWFLPRPEADPRMLFEKDADKKAVFFPEGKSILWFSEGEAYEYTFPQEEPLS